MDKTIICPGCGWMGTIEMLGHLGCCPECDYENGLEPYRLLTISEMFSDTGEYADTRMDLFLKSLFKFLGSKAKSEWRDYQIAHWSAIDGE